jgi:AraC-like DNA-binding protein
MAVHSHSTAEKRLQKSTHPLIKALSAMIEQRNPRSVHVVSSLFRSEGQLNHRAPRLLLCLSGRAECRESKHTEPALMLEAGDAIFAGPDSTIAPTRLSDCEWLGLTFGWKYIKIFHGPETDPQPGDASLILPSDKPPEPLRDVLEYVERLTDFEHGAYAAPARAFLSRLIFIKLLESIGMMDERDTIAQSASRRRFLTALECVGEHFKEPLLREEVGKRAGLSGAQVNRLFQRHLGRSFGEALTQRRLEHARLLVRSTRHRIRDIAHACGFLHSDYFIQVFRKKYQTTPLQMRKHHLAALQKSKTQPHPSEIRK